MRINATTLMFIHTQICSEYNAQKQCGDSGMHLHPEPPPDSQDPGNRGSQDSDTLALGWSNLLANALYILHTLIQFNGRINLAHLLHFKTHAHTQSYLREHTPAHRYTQVQWYTVTDTDTRSRSGRQPQDTLLTLLSAGEEVKAFANCK